MVFNKHPCLHCQGDLNLCSALIGVLDQLPLVPLPELVDIHAVYVLRMFGSLLTAQSRFDRNGYADPE